MKYSFPYFILIFVQGNKKKKVDTKNKIDNLRSVDGETIQLVQDEDYDNGNTSGTSRQDETSFTDLDVTEPANFTIQTKNKTR